MGAGRRQAAGGSLSGTRLAQEFCAGQLWSGRWAGCTPRQASRQQSGGRRADTPVEPGRMKASTVARPPHGEMRMLVSDMSWTCKWHPRGRASHVHFTGSGQTSQRQGENASPRCRRPCDLAGRPVGRHPPGGGHWACDWGSLTCQGRRRGQLPARTLALLPAAPSLPTCSAMVRFGCLPKSTSCTLAAG